MSFNDNVSLDSGRERGGRGGGGRGIAVGGGGGVLLLVIAGLAYLMGGPGLAGEVLNAGTGGQGQSQQQGASDDFSHCKTGADANKFVECRVIGTVNSLDVVWAEQAPKLGVEYKKPGLDMFTRQVNTGCGNASSAVGPFYCPRDTTAYFDTTFFDQLTERFGANKGPLAQEFVVAHEVGHHISHQIGTLGRAQQDPKGPESGAVRVELQADCFAGIWAHHASTTPAPGSNTPFLKKLTDQDIRDALSAAAAVGDDAIQQKSSGQVRPESFTHGTSKQRQQWFLNGYSSGDPRVCDTFSVDV